MIAPAGVDKCLPKSGAWTTRGDAHNVVDMRYSVSPVVRPEDEMNLPELEQSQRLRRATSKGVRRLKSRR